jgi:hypothetical protein
MIKSAQDWCLGEGDWRQAKLIHLPPVIEEAQSSPNGTGTREVPARGQVTQVA